MNENYSFRFLFFWFNWLLKLFQSLKISFIQLLEKKFLLQFLNQLLNLQSLIFQPWLITAQLFVCSIVTQLLLYTLNHFRSSLLYTGKICVPKSHLKTSYWVPNKVKAILTVPSTCKHNLWFWTVPSTWIYNIHVTFW